MTDPIADMLIRIKNAYLARKEDVIIPHSKMKESLARVLASGKYIDTVEIVKKTPQSEIVVKLRYVGKRPAITQVRRVSKPGRRLYAPCDQIMRTLGGYGMTIVSTSKGIMDDKNAKKNNIGGEVIAQVW